MDGKTSIKYLQNYIKSKDYNPNLKKEYFLRLTEEIGELAQAMRKNSVGDGTKLIGTVDEEIWDVIYYAIAIANCYNVDLEKTIKQKEEINRAKYNHTVVFETDR